MNIIGICGKAGSGKSTVADILVEDHGYVSVSLADPMKRFLKEIFQFSDEQLWGPSEKRNAPDKRYKMMVPRSDLPEYLSPRVALQQLGTQWGRAMFEDVWINYALKMATAVLRPNEKTEMMTTVYTYEAAKGLCFNAYYAHTGAPEAVRGVVIPDIRFQNERARIREAGGRIWHRPGEGSLGKSTHASETSLGEDFKYDAEIPWLEDVADLLSVTSITLNLAR